MKVEVFVHLDSCICNFASLITKVGRTTSKFKDSVQVQIKSIKSPEALKHGIRDMCVVLNGKIKLPLNFDEKELEDAISVRLVPRGELKT